MNGNFAAFFMREKIIQAEIELMVSDGHGIDAHGVEYLDIGLSLEDRGHRRALQNVSRDEQECLNSQLPVLRADLLDQGRNPGYSSHFNRRAVFLFYFKGLEVAVKIIKEQDREFLDPRRGLFRG